MGAYQSPSESPRLALRQVDIDIDSPASSGSGGDASSVGRQTPPRERLIPRTNTTPAQLPSLVESSPSTSELEVRAPVIDILSQGEKEALSRTNSDEIILTSDNKEEPATKAADEQKPQVVIGDDDDDDDDEEEAVDLLQSPRLKVGDVVRISEELEGQVRFYGKTQFADGTWVGIALSIPEGM